MLHKVEFECKVLTPMFLAGADQNDVELRPPSIRGMLRYWYRALLGGRGVTDLRALAREEALVFGSTDAGSPISIRVRGGLDGQPQSASSLLSDEKNDSPLRYLWYSTTLGQNDRCYFPPGTNFSVSLSTSRDPGALQQAVGAFWMLVHCGGLGTRSRRMAGSFAARVVRAPNDLQLPSFAPGTDFKQYFQEQLTAIQQTLPAGQHHAARPGFDTLHPQYSKVWLAGKSAREWKEVVRQAGADFRRYRLRRGSSVNPATGGYDYQTIKDFLQKGAAPATVERASFGLPLTFRFSSVPDRRVEIAPAGYNRRASPLWMQVVKLTSGELDAIFTFFDSEFLLGSSQLTITAKGKGPFRRNTIAAPQNSLVPDFVRQLSPIQLYP